MLRKIIYVLFSVVQNYTREKLQYGARNDAWVAVSEAVDNAKFMKEAFAKDGSSGLLTEDIKDFNAALTAAVNAMDDYFTSVPKEVLEKTELLAKDQ